MKNSNPKSVLFAFVLFLSLLSVNDSVAQGDSITFFLLRGIGREAGHWGDVYPGYVKQHFPGAQFVMMDLPGAGKYHDKSALPTVEKMADFLREEHLGMVNEVNGKRVIVATSLAGNVALEWIHQYPGDFHGAILLSTSLKGICKAKDRVRPEAKKQFVNIFLTNDIAEREKEFLSINSNLNVGNDSLLTAWQGVQQARPVSKGALLKQTVAGMLYKPSKEVPEVPVLLVGSKADKIVGQECFESIAETLGGDLILHETAGHGIPIDAPQWLAEVSTTWISENAVPFEYTGTKESEVIKTRTKDNGLLAMGWMNKSVKNSGQVFQSTGKAFTDSWEWVDDGFDWIGGFMKEVKVSDNSQKKQLKRVRKQLNQEQRQIRAEDTSST